jgi:methylmalonyl-CoA mutase N-terminal domain/subunit
VDPFAGSYAVESLTDDLEEAARALIQAVEEHGGAVAAIEQGFQKREIERSAYTVARQIDSGERTVVGVNRFVTNEMEPYQPLQVDPQLEAEQCKHLAALRRDRDASAVSGALSVLRRAAEGTDNVLFPMKAALAALATTGEVSAALRDVWGRYSPADVF